MGNLPLLRKSAPHHGETPGRKNSIKSLLNTKDIHAMLFTPRRQEELPQVERNEMPRNIAAAFA
ncbi:hypothetical protein [Sinorhizobium sp. RAC02]|uniref:hypothetical protein n=1 Tax=Sinorhizobium sp. RAC02 TaxID=1842534 RepID=UPI0012375A62|nr:hypothetical protein [Sinorhizobium sp. RAC02]